MTGTTRWSGHDARSAGAGLSTLACVNGCTVPDRHLAACQCAGGCTKDHDEHCEGCLPRRASYGAWCKGCEHRVLKALADVVECWPEMFTGRTSASSGGGSAPAMYTREDDDQAGDDVPAVDRTVDVRHELLEVLGRLARWYVAEAPVEPAVPDGSDGVDLARFVGRHLGWYAAQRRAAAAVYDEIRTVASTVRRTARPERRDWTPLGPCPVCEEAGAQGSVRGFIDRTFEIPWGVCDTCGTSAWVDWWERRMYPDRDTSRLITAEQLVTLVHRQFGRAVKPSTVRWWVHEGVIAPAACALVDRANLFDTADVVLALSQKGIA